MVATISLFEEHFVPPAVSKTVIIFGVTRGGTSMVAGAVRGFGYDLGADLLVNQEDADFYYKTDEHMKATIARRNLEQPFWGWKYPMAADYIERLLPELRNPLFIIVARDVVATAAKLVSWDDRDASGAIAEAALQMQRNLTLAIRLRLPTLFVSYEKASLDTDQFLDELERFLRRPLVVDRSRLRRFMVPGSYKSFEDIVLSPEAVASGCEAAPVLVFEKMIADGPLPGPSLAAQPI